MSSKNVNFGSVKTESGNIHLGDNYGDTYVTNIIDGLGILLSDYKQQLSTIEQFIYQFKVTTALDLLVDLEQRVVSNNVPQQEIILSKLYYLKASCKRESSKYSRQSAATDFIQSYKRNPSDSSLRDRACVEYLNLDEEEKAEEMAAQILQIDEFNRTAWYVKAICADDFKNFIPKIPRSVFNEYNFQMTMVAHVIATYDLRFLEDVVDFSLRAEVAFDKYTELKFFALEAWRQAIDLAINNFFNDFPVRYIHGEQFLYNDNAYINPVFTLLEKYVVALQDTEIADSINHQRFFYGYFGYLIRNDAHFFKIVADMYSYMPADSWVFTFCYCQLLNHNKDYTKSLSLLDAYLKKEREGHGEAYLMQSAILLLTGQEDLIPNIFTSYLASVPVIEERNGFNIFNTFLNVLAGKVDESVLLSQINLINQKEFKNNEIKTLLNIALTVRYLKHYDKEDIYHRLTQLMSFESFDMNWKNLIAENLNALGRRSEAIKFMETYVDKTAISESLRLYINLLHDQLTDENEHDNSNAEEVLALLKFWRLHSTFALKEFLRFEHNLYTELNDIDNLEEIDNTYHRLYPDDEQALLLYLNVLERGHKLDKIKEVTASLKQDFENESFGVNISIILIRSGADIQKGFTILYNLAKEKNNTVARRNYFGLSMSKYDFFKSFEAVSLGNWVTYRANGQTETIRIEKQNGIQKELLGKKANDIFQITSGISKREVEIQIVEILNDAFHLLRDIQAEMNNPANDLGFESFHMPSDPEELQEFLKSTFGAQGTEEKNHVEKALDDYYNYRTGFTEVTSAVFKKSYIDAYLHLTGLVGNKFTTIPSIFTKPVNYTNPSTVFAIDFSTVMLFYFLEKKMDFHFIHKFSISFYIKNEIERELLELETSPASKMTVQITDKFIRRYDVPEDYYQVRQELLLSLLQWIDINCKVDLVSEKLNLLPKFKEGERFDDYMKIIVDYMCLCDRADHQVLTSDSSLYSFTKRNNTIGNIVNPEKYLISFYPEKCDSSFYRFLLQSNYLGIGISLDTLKIEFFNLLAGSQTYYYSCLENLQFSIHSNNVIIEVISKFLKEMYLMKSLTTETKNDYASELLTYAMIGMPKNVNIALGLKLQQEFMLLGNLSDELRNVYQSVIRRL